MTRYLLDTDAIIDYLKGVQSSIDLIQSIPEKGDLACVCDIVLAEIYSGLTLRQRAQSEIFLSALEYVPIGPESACQAGIWRYDYARRGKILSTTDCLIAAAAYEIGAILITGNARDYPMKEISILPLQRS